MKTEAEAYRHFLETLTPEALDRLSEFVVENVRFRDPFNDVRGADAMARVFQHMFETVTGIEFTVQHMAVDGEVCLMAWRFAGKISGRDWEFEGTSVVRFAEDGRVISHTDHWDAGRSLYERLPVIGWLLAAVRRRIAIR